MHYFKQIPHKIPQTKQRKENTIDCVDRHACMRACVCVQWYSHRARTLIIATNSNITRAYELSMTMFDYVHVYIVTV